MQNDRSRIEDIFYGLIDSFPFTVVTDQKGSIIKISKSYAEYLGVSEAEVGGKHITDIIPNSGLPKVLENGKSTVGDIFVLKNGEPIIVSRYPITKDGQLIGGITTTVFDELNIIKSLNRKLDKLKVENYFYRKKLKELQSFRLAVDNIVGDTEEMRHLKCELLNMANSDAGILISGETGVGKEIFANAIHYSSPRHNGPYVKINCAALPSELIESELFGYEGGAFSGANKQGKIGKFELANHGTILLDEIGEMPLNLQSKLLRVLQENEVERVGGITPHKIDVRVICSTNRNLEKMVEDGDFRSDLYYRINVLELKIPPLRQRKEDIGELIKSLIRENNVRDKVAIEGVEPEVVSLFQLYDWPGNVRELKHVLERAGIMAREGVLTIKDFDFFASNKIGLSTEYGHKKVEREGHIIAKKDRLEKYCIMEALSKFYGNKKKAAEYLGISRSTLYEKIKTYNLK